MAMDFQQGIAEVEQKYHPDYLLIEPSGVGRLSDVVKACTDQGYSVDQLITMVDLSSYEDYASSPAGPNSFSITATDVYKRQAFWFRHFVW